MTDARDVQRKVTGTMHGITCSECLLKEREIERLLGEATRWEKAFQAETLISSQAIRRAETAEAQVWALREALTGVCARYDEWYLNGQANRAADMAYELVSAIRAALATALLASQPSP